MNELLKQTIWIYVLFIQAAWGLTLALGLWAALDLLRWAISEREKARRL